MKCLLINPYSQTIKEVDSETNKIARALLESILPNHEELPSGDRLTSDSRDLLDTDYNFYGVELPTARAVAFGFSLIQPGPGRTLKSTPTLTHAWIETSHQANNAIQRTYF